MFRFTSAINIAVALIATVIMLLFLLSPPEQPLQHEPLGPSPETGTTTSTGVEPRGEG